MPRQSSDGVEIEERTLAPYAMRSAQSRGRVHAEPDHAFRSPYPRDRDRIVHSTAFRRLSYKTQVFVSQTNDHHRTRLTHTLEVAQIARTIARQLRLNEDLTEAIALMHDLGHPPFGHAGERTLAECMREQGGFEHNRHGLRIVEELEYRYPDFPGLNLTWEVLEAQAMHSKAVTAPEVARFLGVGQPLLEAQVVDAADSLAYITHDTDDALGAELLTPADLEQVEFWRLALERVRSRSQKLTPLNLQPTVVRALIDWQVTDLIAVTRANLDRAGIASVADVRAAPESLVAMGPETTRLRNALQAFLRERVYRHPRVHRMVRKGQRMLRAMFDELCTHPEQLPERYMRRAEQTSLPRTVCDYLAGMTDRFAQLEYMRLFQPGFGS